jgi:hypothetical protein
VSGNYILKVFLDGDTAKLAFETIPGFENRAIISSNVVQPFNPITFAVIKK